MLKEQRLHYHLIAPKLVFILFASVGVILMAGASWAQDQAINEVDTKTLQGGVQHDEQLPSLPDDYQVGKRFDPAQLTALTPNNLWYPIPDWFGGKWHSESMTITSVQDCTSGKSEKVHLIRKEVADTTHGQQRDKTGQIWDFLKIPRVIKVAVDGGTCYLTCSSEDILQSDSSAVVFKALTSQITIDKSKRVISSEQVQQISRTRPLDEGLIQIEGSLKNFTADGDPAQIQTVEKVVQKTAPYQEIDTDGDLNLKQLFIEFLKKTGRQELLPPGS